MVRISRMIIEIEEECEKCSDPTKVAVGFLEGTDGKHVGIYDCRNQECTWKFVKKLEAIGAERTRARVQKANGRRGMFAGYIAAKRRDAKVSMYTLAGITGCTPVEYRNYEHEYREFPEKVYRKGMAYLEKRIAERRAESDSSTKK